MGEAVGEMTGETIGALPLGSEEGGGIGDVLDVCPRCSSQAWTLVFMESSLDIRVA